MSQLTEEKQLWINTFLLYLEKQGVWEHDTAENCANKAVKIFKANFKN